MDLPTRRCEGKIKRTHAQLDGSGECSTIPVIVRCSAEATVEVIEGGGNRAFCSGCFETIRERLPKDAEFKPLAVEGPDGQ